MEKLIAAERTYFCGCCMLGGGGCPPCPPVEKRPACSTRSQLELEMDADKGKQRQYSQRMAEPRFNNPYFWPPPPTMPSQLDNLVLINKIKEQLMAEKIRPPPLAPHLRGLPAAPPGAPLARRKQPIHHVPPQTAAGPGAPPSSRPPARRGPSRPTSHQHRHRVGAGFPRAGGQHLRIQHGDGDHHPIDPHLHQPEPPHRLLAHPNLRNHQPPAPRLHKDNPGATVCWGHPRRNGAGRRSKRKILRDPPVLVVPYPILASGETAKEGKTYRCKVCPLTFFTKSEMQIHSKSHTEAKPHKCPHCSKSFANASYLAQHLRIHLGVKPYHCSYCEKSFRQLSHLQQHTRIHTGDRPYKCPHPGCEKAFTQLSNLQSHQRQHNKDKPYKCPNCYPGVHGLGLAPDPPLGSRHQTRQGLLLQHVRPRLYLVSLKFLHSPGKDVNNVGLDEPCCSREKDEREEVEISTRLSHLTRRSHSPMTREGDSSLLEEQGGISNMLLM
ncbi:unnamed protein product [Bubo scandiacus]